MCFIVVCRFRDILAAEIDKGPKEYMQFYCENRPGPAGICSFAAVLTRGWQEYAVSLRF